MQNKIKKIYKISISQPVSLSRQSNCVEKVHLKYVVWSEQPKKLYFMEFKTVWFCCQLNLNIKSLKQFGHQQLQH